MKIISIPGIVIFAVLFSVSVFAASPEVDCKYEETKAICRYDVRFGAKVTDVTADGKQLNIVNHRTYPNENDTIDIAILIDLSEPEARSEAVKEAVDAVGRILPLASNHHNLMIAGFEAGVTVISPFGNKEKIKESVGSIKPKGQATALYNSIIEISKELDNRNAARKVILMFSDGQAEDTANRDSVNKHLRDYKIEFSAFGYAHSPSKAAALQNLQSLARDHNGFYREAAIKGQLPATQHYKVQYQHVLSNEDINMFFEHVNRGGVLEIDTTGIYGKQTLNFNFLVGNEGISVRVDAKFPNEKSLLLIVAVIGAIFLSIGIYLFIANKKKGLPPEFGFLEELGANQGRYPVVGSGLIIGRSPDSTLRIVNDSVSGSHAAIKISREGNVTITDLNSSNGTLVNDVEVISPVVLNDNDIITLGEVRLRFCKRTNV